jgi:polyisoprenoid-binding protein YceI
VVQDPAACSLEVTIDTSSISTQNSVRDEDLRGDFFDVQKFPTTTYVVAASAARLEIPG